MTQNRFDPKTPDTIEAIFYDEKGICIRFKNWDAAKYFFDSTKDKFPTAKIETNKKTQPPTYDVSFPTGFEEIVAEELLAFPDGQEMNLKIKNALKEPGSSTEDKRELWSAKKKGSPQAENKEEHKTTSAPVAPDASPISAAQEDEDSTDHVAPRPAFEEKIMHTSLISPSTHNAHITNLKSPDLFYHLFFYYKPLTKEQNSQLKPDTHYRLGIRFSSKEAAGLFRAYSNAAITKKGLNNNSLLIMESTHTSADRDLYLYIPYENGVEEIIANVIKEEFNYGERMSALIQKYTKNPIDYPRQLYPKAERIDTTESKSSSKDNTSVDSIFFHFNPLTKQKNQTLGPNIHYRFCIRFNDKKAAEQCRDTINLAISEKKVGNDCISLIEETNLTECNLYIPYEHGIEIIAADKFMESDDFQFIGNLIKRFSRTSIHKPLQLDPTKLSKVASPTTPRKLETKNTIQAEVKAVIVKTESKESKSAIKEEKVTESIPSILCDPPYDFIPVRTTRGKERSKLRILFSNRDAAIKFHQELKSDEAKIADHHTLHKTTVSVSLPLYNEQKGINILEKTPGCEAAASIIFKGLTDKRKEEDAKKDEAKKESKGAIPAIKMEPILANLTGITCNFKTPFKVTQSHIKQKSLDSNIRLDFTDEAKANEFFKLFKELHRGSCDYIIQPSASHQIVGGIKNGSGASVYIKQGRENSFFGAMKTILNKTKSHNKLSEYFNDRLKEPMYYGCCCPSIFNSRLFKYSKDRKIEAALFYLLKGQGAAMSSTHSGALNQGTLATAVQSIRNAG